MPGLWGGVAISKERIVFQPSFFRAVKLQGCNMAVAQDDAAPILLMVTVMLVVCSHPKEYLIL